MVEGQVREKGKANIRAKSVVVFFFLHFSSFQGQNRSKLNNGGARGQDGCVTGDDGPCPMMRGL